MIYFYRWMILLFFISSLPLHNIIITLSSSCPSPTKIVDPSARNNSQISSLDAAAEWVFSGFSMILQLLSAPHNIFYHMHKCTFSISTHPISTQAGVLSLSYFTNPCTVFTALSQIEVFIEWKLLWYLPSAWIMISPIQVSYFSPIITWVWCLCWDWLASAARFSPPAPLTLFSLPWICYYGPCRLFF